MVDIGKRIRATRQRRVMSQDDLSKETGMPKASISRLERGATKPRPSSIRKVAAALGVTPEWLAFGNEPDAAGPAKA